jgi:hypothetical protein
MGQTPFSHTTGQALTRSEYTLNRKDFQFGCQRCKDFKELKRKPKDSDTCICNASSFPQSLLNKQQRHHAKTRY